MARRLLCCLQGGDVFERASAVDTVVFDKTGTLTRDSLGVVSVYHTFGYTALTAQAAVVPLLAVSVASALVELLPKGQGVMAVLTDDNLTVPACAALVGSLLLR